MYLGEPRRSLRERFSEIPRGWKASFAVAAVLIMLFAIAASVHHEMLNDHAKGTPDPHLRVIDLDFLPAAPNKDGVGYRVGGPLGTLELGAHADGRLLSFWYGKDFVTIEAAGSTFSTMDSWKGEVGKSAPTVDGIHGRYPTFYP